MIDENGAKVARTRPAAREARQSFLGWQCRIRQLSVRHDDGRPGPGMRPTVRLAPIGVELGRITVLIRKRKSAEVTARFQHMVRRTRDPAERRESALQFLAAAYYQRPDSFSDHLTALFGPDASIAERLIEAGACRLDFEQFGQRFELDCRVEGLAEHDAAFQFTYWHNSLFNPVLPAGVRVLGFQPDWSTGTA
jgi:hypothetical protein